MLNEEISKNSSKNIIPNLVLNLADIQKNLQKYISKRYFNSQPIFSITNKKPLINLNFTLTDILLIGAITQSSVLLSGSSGSGKTLLAELVSNFLFGKDGVIRKNITPDLNEQDFMDIDFGAIKAGKKLKEAMLADDLFSRPCLIIDEANRAPSIIQNRLIQILENSIDIKSKIIHAGVLLNNGMKYHWNILTLNYGEEYAGTSTVDRALRDRITLDIPIDNFPPTLDDQIRMIRESLFPKDRVDLTSTGVPIYDFIQNMDKINLSLEAEALILYMSFTSNCIKSPTGSKYGVIFSPQYCKDQDCPYARNPPLNKICPYTYAPSNRILRRLVHVSKGLCLLRHAKVVSYLKEHENKEELTDYLLKIQNLEVGLQDVSLIAPFVLHSKISINREWVRNKFNGNSFLACIFYLKVINEQLNFFMKNLLLGIVSEKNGKTLSEKDIGIRKKALKDDFHFEGLIKYVKKYLK
ncbi:MAG: AAA family ATPase [Candidatus Helarchaeota archaeon]